MPSTCTHKPLSLILAAAVVMGWSAVAAAGPFELFGFGARASSLGGAMTASADDHTSLFYNPAALTLQPDTFVGADIYLSLASLDVNLDQPVNDPALEPAAVDNHMGFSVGAAFVSRLGGVPVALGFAAGVPIGGVFDLELLDPQIPQWTRYDALPRKLHLLAGLSVQPAPWLHLGLGAQSLASLQGGATFEMDAANEVVARRDATIELLHTLAPTAGVLINPGAGLRLGVNYRAAMALDFDLPIAFEFGQDAEVVLGVAGITLYVPHRIATGLAWDLEATTGAPVTLSLDAAWELWSQSPDPALELPIDTRGDAPEGLGLGDALDFELDAAGDPRHRDTLNLSGGLEVRVLDWLTLRGGYGHRPATTAAQQGLSNYIDNDAHVVGLGAGLRLPDPISAKHAVHLDLSTQWTAITDRRTQKTNPDDPIGGYSAGGSIVTFTATIRRGASPDQVDR